MEIIYLLIPLSILMVLLIVWIFFLAVRAGQFEDLDGAGYRILFDDDDHPRPKR